MIQLIPDIIIRDLVQQPPSSSLPKSCLEINYMLFNATSGVTSITYRDMDDLLFCASSLTSILVQLANIKGEKGDNGIQGSKGKETLE